MSKSIKRVRGVLEAAGIEPDIREMPGDTRTAQQAADAVGCALDQIAKSIIFHGPASDRIFLFVTAGGSRVDPVLAARVAGEPLGRADAALVRARTGFAIGGVAPIGHLTPSPAFFDPLLLTFSEVWAAAGTPRHVFPICPIDLERISAAQQADFTSENQEM